MKTQRGSFRKGNYAAYVKINMPFIGSGQPQLMTRYERYK